MVIFFLTDQSQALDETSSLHQSEYRWRTSKKQIGSLRTICVVNDVSRFFVAPDEYISRVETIFLSSLVVDLVWAGIKPKTVPTHRLARTSNKDNTFQSRK